MKDFFDSQVVYKKKNGEWVEAGTVYLVVVLQFGSGGEMIRHLMTGGALGEDLGRFYFKQLIAAVKHLHQNSVCHRDIKPDNILLDENYSLRLADYGYVGTSQSHADGRFRTYLGTREYMAPEIFRTEDGRSSYDGFKADIFACGVCLFTFVIGRPPLGKAMDSDPFFKAII